MLIVQVNMIDAETLERSVARLLHVFRLAADRSPVGILFCADVGKFRGEKYVIAARTNCPPDKFFVIAHAVCICRIEEIDAQIERAKDRGGGFLVIARAVKFAHAHAAEAHARDNSALRSEFYFVHKDKPSTAVESDTAETKPRRYTFLMHGHWAAGLHLLHQEDERDHYEDAPSDKPEIVDVSEHRSLLMNHVRDHRVGLLRCNAHAGAMRHEFVDQGMQRGFEPAVSAIEHAGEPRLMKLRAAGKHRGYEGNAQAAADVSSQIDEARCGVVLLFRQKIGRAHVDRHEQTRKPDALKHAGERGCPEIN